ncbi:ATP phosphoribosyltransferase regulatory subunit [Alphaproteobacteria bacterium]|nr:ATP phosphoribosyltransferase regulatory subunit [Alphaproteobacteria bacterium]
MSSLSNQKGLLPAGLSDILYPNAHIQSKIIENLLDIFSSYGYLRVKPPLVEYEEALLSDGPGKVLKDSTFRVMDPLSQKMLALRADVTAQISRIASTRLSHLSRPLRLSYSGDVLRVKGDSFNMERQKTQVGAELIGPKSEVIDAEIMLVCVKALKSINIDNLTIDINLPFLRKYLLTGISPSLKRTINQYIDIKDKQSLKKLKFENLNIISELMDLVGDHLNVIKYLQELKSKGILVDIIDHYLTVINIVKKNDKSIKLSIDPLENRAFKYHTGITFTIFSDKLKGELAKGGSYNILTGETATGCTIYTEKVYPNLMLNLDKDLVYIPYLNMKDADEIIKKGYRVVFGSVSNSEFEKEASEMKCKYIWKDKIILKLKS